MTPRYDTPPEKIKALKLILAAYPGNNSETQCRRLRSALSIGPVTTFEAQRYLDIYDPAARIWKMRQVGDPIEMHWVASPTESGRLHRIGLYVLQPRIAHGGDGV